MTGDGCEQSAAARGATAPSDARRGQYALLESQRRRDRQSTREQLTLSAHLGLELRTTRTAPHMVAQRPAAAPRTNRGRELLADLHAGDRSRLATRRERGAGLEDERLHLLGLALDDPGDLRMLEIAGLGEQQGRSLTLGQVPEVDEQLAKLGALLDLLGEARARQLLDLLDRLLPAPAQDTDAVVAGDPEEPRLEQRRLLVAGQGPESRAEGVLERILGILAGPEHVAAEVEQGAVVAVVDGLEGALVAALGFTGQPLIAESAVAGDASGKAAMSGGALSSPWTS